VHSSAEEISVREERRRALLGEYVHTKAEAQGIDRATSNAAAASAILFC
jgi:hypothetical protein